MDAVFLRCWVSRVFLKRVGFAIRKEVNHEEYQLQW